MYRRRSSFPHLLLETRSPAPDFIPTGWSGKIRTQPFRCLFVLCVLIQRQRPDFVLRSVLVLDYLQHGWRLLPPGGNQGSRVCHAEGYAAFFMLVIRNFGSYLNLRFHLLSTPAPAI